MPDSCTPPVAPPPHSPQLAAPHPVEVLDAAPEPRFDRITRTARRLLGTPVAFISLIDKDRRWLKSALGTQTGDLPLWIPFCAQAMGRDAPLVVEDAAADPRFADSPLVTGGPRVRFFAAWALHDPNGLRVGTLAVADCHSRQAGEADLDALHDLAEWAESELNNHALRHALLAANESEARMHAVVDNVADGIITLDEFGVITGFNPAAERIFGYHPDEVIGHNIAILMPAAYHHAHDNHLKNFRDTGRTAIIGVDREVTGRRKDGSRFAMELTVNEMTLTGRRGFVGVLRDITARRDAERKLLENSALMQTVMGSSKSFVYVRDMEGRFLFVNKEYERVFGFAPGQVIGRKIDDVFPPGLARYNTGMDNAILASGPNGRREDEVRLNDGEQIFLVVRSPLVNEKGEIYGVCGVGTDITHRKHAEEAMQVLNRQLSETTQLQQAILDSANFSIIATDENGVIRLFNNAAERMLGYTAAELVGRATPELLHDPEEVAARAKRLSIELGRPVSPGLEVLIARSRNSADEQEWHYIRKDGSRLPVMLSVTAIRDAAQTITGYLGIAYDMTERKKTEQIKNEFISTVSHELRTPLTSIRGSLGLLTGGVAGDIPLRARSLLEIANNNCERLVRLINDILDIEKIESGHMRFEMVRQRMLPLVEHALAATQHYAEQYQVQFDLHADAADAYVTVDGDRMVQVIVNLLSNAAKFSPPGSRVDVRLVQSPGSVRLSVIDRGEGIADGFRERIFQKFAQADSSDTRQKGGTGLGLSISRAIVDRHHGRIHFNSTPGSGSEFYVELPLAVPGIGQTPQFGRVLICEDDPDIARLLGLMLAQAGLTSDIAFDAEQARRMLLDGGYEAMTLDLALPREDGLSLLRWMRAQDGLRSLPVVVVSALAEEGRRKLTGGAVGIVDWIAKPIDEERLMGALREALRGCEEDVPQVLHVEDDRDLVEVVATLLQPAFSVSHAATLADARDKLTHDGYSLILLDLILPDGHGSELLASLPPRNATTPVVVFSVEEANQPMADSVHAALVKSRTSNEQLLSILHGLIGQARRNDERMS
ncbi:MAG TPA: PAS domain S-box protein [Noviherbaspirillum sp.]